MSTTTVSTGHSEAGAFNTLSGGGRRRGTVAAADPRLAALSLHARSAGEPIIAVPPTSPAVRRN
ncbi:MAG TPA: hypothetical protein VKC52_05325 [Acidimicrobiia bacterium]|nr:hypothetical protein [Acidimicrobiia bacterium]